MAESQIPSNSHLPKARVQVLLMRANDLGFGAENLRGSMTTRAVNDVRAWLMTMLEQLLRFFDFKEILPHIEIDED